MTKEQYLKQRNEMMAAIEALIGEGKTEEAEAKMKEVEDLDNKWESIKLANANMNALKDKTKATDIANKSEKLEGGTIVDDNKTVNTEIDETKVYENAWAKSIMGKKLDDNERVIFDKVNAEFRNEGYTHSTGIATSVPTLIPQSVVAGIWKRAEEMYPLLADVRKYNVRGTLVINKHTGIDSGDAAFYDEDTATADEKNIWGTLSLGGHELAKAITVSWKMRSMSIEEFVPFLQRELGERVGVAMGVAIAKGGGKTAEPAEPEGIETALAAESQTPQIVTYKATGTEAEVLSYDKITTAISKIHSSYLAGCAIYANNATIWTKLATLKDKENRPLFIPDVTAGGVGRMFGMVVKTDAGVSADNILIGNADKGYVMNTNEPMSLATEEHVKARTVDYAAYAIVDGGVLDTKAFALLKKSD